MTLKMPMMTAAIVALALGGATVTQAQTSMPGTTGSAAIQSDAASKLNETSIRTTLGMQGYSEVRDLKMNDRSGEVKAKRDGKDVSLKLKQMRDVQTPLDEASVRKSLEDEGYKSVENLKPEDTGFFKAKAERDGDDVRLFVDNQGLVVEEQDSDS